MIKYIQLLKEGLLNHKTYTGSSSIKVNVDAIIDEITKTKNVLDKSSMQFWNYRRFLLTLGFVGWTRHNLRDTYFKQDTEDFYHMIIGKKPVSLRAIKLRAKSFLGDVENYNNFKKY